MTIHICFLIGLKERLEILLHDKRSNLIAADRVGICWEKGCGSEVNCEERLENKLPQVPEGISYQLCGTT